MTAEDAYLVERSAIGILGRLDNGTGSLLNTMEGGYGPRRYTPSTRGKISAALSAVRRGMKFSAEHCANMRAVRLGQKLGDEARAKISAAHRGRKRTPEAVANLREASRKLWATSEHRAKMAAVHRGRKCSLETREKMSAANRGKKRAKISEVSEPLITDRIVGIGTGRNIDAWRDHENDHAMRYDHGKRRWVRFDSSKRQREGCSRL